MFNEKKRKQIYEEILIILNSLDENIINLSKSKEELANEIIELIILITNNYINNGFKVELDDVIQETYQVLLESAITDKSKLHGGYENYIRMSIKERIELLFLENKVYIYISKELKLMLRQYINSVIKLTERLGRKPSISEISSFMGKETETIKKISSIYEKHKNVINFGTTNFDNLNYSNIDEYNQDTKELIFKLLTNVDLSEAELAIILMYYGIVLPNQEKICYNNTTFILDGIPRNLENIGKIFSVTLERCRQLLNGAHYKLFTSNQTLVDLKDYAYNPDLYFRIKDIYNWINVIPFTDKYPNIKSFFPEYTDTEVSTVLNELSDFDKAFLKSIEKFDKEVTEFNYGLRENKKLFTIIRMMYNQLIEKFGRRVMVTESSTCKFIKYGQFIDKLRDFYGMFDEYDENIITYYVTKLTDYQRNILHGIFGTNLKTTLTPNEILKLEPNVISAYDNLIWTAKTKLRKNSLEPETASSYSEYIKNYTTNTSNNNLAGIYKVLSTDSNEIIKPIINELFLQELAILKKVFGENLTDNKYLINLEKLSTLELAIFNNIINNMKNKIKNIQHEKQLQEKRTKKIEVFYKIFMDCGYSFEEVDDILKDKIGFDLMKEYLKYGMSTERREEIISIIYKMLYDKYGPAQIQINPEFKYSRIRKPE